MISLPHITIVMTTYFPLNSSGADRWDAMIKTVKSWEKYLIYSEHIYLDIQDDGSVGRLLPSTFNFSKTTKDIGNREGVGASLNRGFSKAFSKDHLVMYAVDDWSLTNKLELTPWAQLLTERKDIGMIRLGPPHPNLKGRVEHLGELGWGLMLDKYSYVYGQRPALYHKRFTDAYGWFKEGVSAIDCEREYSEHVNATAGPGIMLALPHSWKHIDTISMSDMKPEIK